MDGTLLAAWASQKSVRRKDGSDDDNPDGVGRHAGRNLHGGSRSNETHESRTDPEARLARKSSAAPSRPSYAGHVLMENRNGLVVAATLTAAMGAAERHAGYAISQRIRKRIVEPFGWAKTVGRVRRVMHRGTARVREIFLMTMGAYDLVRLKSLIGT